MVVHARTLEFYRQVGLAELIVERALEFTSANLWVKGRKAARVVFGPMGQGLSQFPYMLILPQDEHERLLIERLSETGVQVERRTELLGFENSRGRVLGRLRRPDGAEPTPISSMSPMSRRAAPSCGASCTWPWTRPSSWRCFR